MKFRALLLTFLTLFAISSHTVADDLLPWPWGSECPFPWSSIEGDWTVQSDGYWIGTTFRFDIKSTLENGTRVLDVTWYDAEGYMVAQGEALSTRGERIVRAALKRFGEKGNSYWAIVRAYHATGKKSCSRGKLVTVITLRSFDGIQDDIHLMLEKSVDEQKSRP